MNTRGSAFSDDLRARVLTAALSVAAGADDHHLLRLPNAATSSARGTPASQSAVARSFQVSNSFVSKILLRARERWRVLLDVVGAVPDGAPAPDRDILAAARASPALLAVLAERDGVGNKGGRPRRVRDEHVRVLTRALEAIPTLLITCEEPGLIGCAVVANEHAVTA